MTPLLSASPTTFWPLPPPAATSVVVANPTPANIRINFYSADRQGMRPVKRLRVYWAAMIDVAFSLTQTTTSGLMTGSFPA